MGQHVGVLMGGWGEEREISLKTGEAIAAALSARGHTVTRVMAGPNLDKTLRGAQLDAAFIALHGRMGEDGRVQGLLEVLGVPYTGSGVMASALAMNKPFAKKLFRLNNLEVPRGYTLGRSQVNEALALHGDLGFPCVVKPSLGGSSVGVTRVMSSAQLPEAVAQACRFGGEALVERFIAGREVTVGVLGDRVLGSCEISFDAQLFDYEAKYKTGAQYHLPARLSATRLTNLEQLAHSAYRALDCRGYARIDFICPDEGNDVLLEVNTLPGMTQTSLLPKIARAAGLTFEDLVEEILERATLDEAEVMPPVVAADAHPLRPTG